ncbi:hypothetical protein M2168_002612 [Streptomyces sp. CZ24]|nr:MULTISPECIES: hypothetical protein [unclassified Streptomyces]MCG5120906.1 hypothetical protein [Streptomyces sp. T7(2022)]MCK2141795.1 hypothetical protein [Streptomyces sp. WAC00276]MCQ9710223.1 hypothetical protein [Streptomyces sp. BSP1]MCR0986670.1 hypothetical protein [Streptomyces albidoflavus]UDF06525.1 hypothetical protein LH646_02610 [Streptomyces sp. WA1-19]UYX94489.1 hypothetical protein OIM89_12450 [Streptomyces sp. BI87]
MTPGRGDRAAPPAPEGHWEVRFADAASAKGWESLARQAGENTYRAWVLLRTEPCPATPTPRHHRLKGALAHGTYRGRPCEQWQIEVTGSGRIWYLLDVSRATCWITYAGTGHPRATDRS